MDDIELSTWGFRLRKSGFGLKSQVGVLKSSLTKDLTRIKTKILFYLNLVFVMFSLT